MKSMYNLLKVAQKFEQKLAQDMQTAQSGTTELFFGSADKQFEFVKALGELKIQGDKIVGTGLVANVLAAYRNKTEQAASFSMDISAEPNQGASIVLDVKPDSLKPLIMQALNKTFMAIVKKPMNDVQKLADEKAKKGAGSGTNHVQNLEVE